MQHSISRPFTLNFQDLTVMKSATESDISTPQCVFFQLCLLQPPLQFVVNAFFLLPLFEMVHPFPSLNTAVSNKNNRRCITLTAKQLHFLRSPFLRWFFEKLRPPVVINYYVWPL